jgi:hypothetical protein
MPQADRNGIHRSLGTEFMIVDLVSTIYAARRTGLGDRCYPGNAAFFARWTLPKANECADGEVMA